MSIKIFQHLLPKSRAWSITIDKKLRQFFDGLSPLGDDAKIFIDEVFEDIDPQKTRELDAWEKQFNIVGPALTEQERRDRLDAHWKAQGGQSPRYIQDILQANGFNVYIHEWWEPGSLPAAVARDPNASNVQHLVVNIIETSSINYVALSGKTAMVSGGVRAYSNNFRGFRSDPVEYEITTDPATFPYYLYFGGEVFGTLASVPASRRNEFETLLKKICPAQQWLALILNYI